MRIWPSASLRLGRIKSIEISINVTWLIIYGLLVYWLRTGFIAESGPNLSEALAWLVSAIGAVVLFASVLAHELAHSLVAQRNGLTISKITLFIFGGVAHMGSEPRTPGVEFKMAIAGPLASIGIAAVLGFVRFVILKSYAEAAPALVVEYATYANAVLACFNLVPGYPLDGGRVLRALLWKVTGNFGRSTLIAASLGRIVGLGIVFLGAMLSAAWGTLSFLWLVLVGSFLERLAYFSIFRVRTIQAGPKIEDVMRTGFAVIAPSITLQAAAAYFSSHTGVQPVIQDGRIVGVLSRAHLASVPEDQWEARTVGASMTPCDSACVARPEESVRVVLRRMLELGMAGMPVASDGRLVGMVFRGDLIAVMRAN